MVREELVEVFRAESERTAGKIIQIEKRTLSQNISLETWAGRRSLPSNGIYRILGTNTRLRPVPGDPERYENPGNGEIFKRI